MEKSIAMKEFDLDSEVKVIKYKRTENETGGQVQMEGDVEVLVKNGLVCAERVGANSSVENGVKYENGHTGTGKSVVSRAQCEDTEKMNKNTEMNVDCTISSTPTLGTAFIDDKKGKDQPTPLNSYTTYQSNKKSFKDFIKSFDTLQSILHEKMQTFRELKETEKKTKPYELINFFSNENTLNSLSITDLKNLYNELCTKLGHADYEFKQEIVKKRIRCIFAAEFRRSITNTAALLGNNELLSFVHVFSPEERYFLMVKYLGERKRKCGELGGALGTKMFVIEEMVRQEVYMFYVVFKCDYERLKGWMGSYWDDGARGYESGGDGGGMNNEREEVDVVDECAEHGKNKPQNKSGEASDENEPQTNTSEMQESGKNSDERHVSATEKNEPNCTNKNCTNINIASFNGKGIEEREQSIDACATKSKSSSTSATKNNQINFYAQTCNKAQFLIKTFVSYLMQNNILKLLEAFVFSVTKNILKEYTHTDIQQVVKKCEETITETVKCGSINDDFADDVRFYTCVILWMCFSEYGEQRMESEGQFEL